MKKYLVGGAVRDMILGRENSDKDYIVVGSSVQEMIDLGFKSAGKSFPVFTRKDLEGEYALARTEKKSGKKHFDFECFTKDVSLQEDLKRRDLTINAIAYDEEKREFIDIFGGIEDIKNKILRPVSEAFKEDALRVVRAARFRAQLGREWRFDEELKIYAYETKNDLLELSKERVYKEVKKAMQSAQASLFFRSLAELGVLGQLFSWIEDMTKAAHKNPYHQEGSVFEHTMMALDLCESEAAQWAVLGHDSGKYRAFTQDGTFHRHCDKQIVEAEFTRIKKSLTLSKNEFEIMRYFAQNHHNLQKIFTRQMRESKIAALLFGIKTKSRLESLLEATLADMNGRIGEKHEILFTKEQLIELWEILKNTDYGVDNKTMSAEQIRSIIAHRQIELTREFMDRTAVI